MTRPWLENWRILRPLWTLLVLILLQGFLPALADEVEELDKRAFELYQSGDRVQGVQIGEQALLLAERLYGQTSLRAGEQANNLGLLYKYEGRANEAKALFERSIAIKEKEVGQEAVDLGSTLRNLALLHYEQGRLKLAEADFRRAIAINLKAAKRDLWTLVTCLDELSDLYADSYRYDDAEQVLKQALVLRTEHPEIGGVAQTLTLDRLRRIYSTTGRLSEAEKTALASLAASEGKVGANQPDNSVQIRNLAAVYRDQGRFDEARALFEKAITTRKKAEGPSSPVLGAFINDLATVYQLESRFPEAQRYYEQALAIYKQTVGTDSREAANTLSNLAAVLEEQGRNGEAEIAIKKSLAIRERLLGPDHLDVAKSLNELGGIYENQGRYQESEALRIRAYEIAKAALGSDNIDVSAYANNLGVFYNGQGRYAEGARLLQASLKVREKVLGKNHPLTAGTANNLAMSYSALGDYRRAEPLLKRALSLFERRLGRNNETVATANNNLGHLYAQAGKYEKARQYYSRALEITKETFGADHPHAMVTLQNIASSYVREGDWKEATNSIAKAAEIAVRRVRRGSDALGAQLSADARHVIDQNRYIFEFLVKALYQTDSNKQSHGEDVASRSFWWAQWIANSEVARSLQEMAARHARINPTLERLTRERQDLVSEWFKLDKLLTAEIAKPVTARDFKTDEQYRRRLGDIDTRVKDIDADLAKRFPDYSSLATLEPLSIEQVQKLLRSNEVLLFFADTQELSPIPPQTFLWMISPTTVRLTPLPVTPAELQSKVEALRDAIGVGREARAVQIVSSEETAPGRSAADLALAYGLFSDLLKPFAEEIANKKLIVVPSKSIASLPFQLLVSEPPSASDTMLEAYTHAHWLIRDHAITVLPSVSSLDSLRRVAHRSRGRVPYVGFGNPLLLGPGETDRRASTYESCATTEEQTKGHAISMAATSFSALFRGSLGDVSEIRKLNPLPETVGELCTVARDLNAGGDAVHLGRNATESELKRQSREGLLRAAVVHFATHGLLAGDLNGQGEPSLVFSPPDEPTEEDDGLLTASEVAALDLDADWIILSACNTAAGESGTAEPLSGLARAFFFAGARSLLVSHWPVNSQAAVELTTRSIKVSQKMDRAEALRAAMISLIDEGGHNARPSYWAPFSLVGE